MRTWQKEQRNLSSLKKNSRAPASRFQISINKAEAEDLSGSSIFEISEIDYLTGVLAGEVPASWPIETLKAQAIAARSYSVYQIQNRQNQNYDLRADVLDQVFLPMRDAVVRDQNAYKILREAVDGTAGLILLEKGSVLKAYFHSDCGGETESQSGAWGGPQSTGPTVKDQACAISAQKRPWRLKLSKFSFLEKLGWREQSEMSVRVLKRGPSGRVQEVEFKSGEKTVRYTGEELRRLLGFNELKSTAFEVYAKADGFEFVGRGWGHGVGLCQKGARTLALSGKTFAEILKHYYPAAELKYVEDQRSSF